MTASGPAPEDLVATLECAKQQVAALAAENQRLQKQVTESEHRDPAWRAIRDEACQEEERRSHQDAMQQLEQENQDLANQLVIADKENSQIVNLYVASSQPWRPARTVHRTGKRPRRGHPTPRRPRALRTVSRGGTCSPWHWFWFSALPAAWWHSSFFQPRRTTPRHRRWRAHGCGAASTHRHTTVGSRVVVYYPFHPLHGRELEVVCAPRRGDGSATVVDPAGHHLSSVLPGERPEADPRASGAN